MQIDHIVMAVSDLDEAADRIAAETGLEPLAGGRHDGHGTHNSIVPLRHAYLELVAVFDSGTAASSPWGSWVSERAVAGVPRPHGWCLRVDDIEAAARRIGDGVTPMRRVRPDGVRLEWRLTGLAGALSERALPFFIQWDVPAALQPGGGDDAGASIDWIEVGDEGLDEWVGPHALPLRLAPGGAGIHRIGIGAPLGACIL